MIPIKFKLIEYHDSLEWKRFKSKYVTRIRKESEVEQAEAFMSGVIQGICCVTPECEKMHWYGDDCSIRFEGFSLNVVEPENTECWLDELMVEVTLDDEEVE